MLIGRRAGWLVMLAAILLLTISGCSKKPQAVPDPSPATAPTDPSVSEPSEDDENSPGPKLAEPGPGEAVNPLTGRVVRRGQLDQRMFMVSIDNLGPARPQAGLPQADLIYEVPAEAGITRYLALFWTGEAEKIGPIRSARHYFLDLVLEWQAVWLHVGGSPQHTTAISRLDIPDIDDLKGGAGGGVFWRTNDRKRPHNLYTGSRQARDKIVDRGWQKQPPNVEPWRYGLPPDLPQGESAPEVRLRWPGRKEQSVFTYDPESMMYNKRNGDRPVIDQVTGEPIPIANVILQKVSTRRIPGDAEGRLEVDLVGQGDIQIFSAGTVRSGKWRKTEQSGATVFTEADGPPITLVPGQTWILIAPSNIEVQLGPEEG